jgi:hypothetical protein
MARIRSVKPEFWTDRPLARKLSRDARLFYIALWNFADEHARLGGDPYYLKGQIFPYDDDVDAAVIIRFLKELEAAGKVVRYEIDDEPYLFLPRLDRHQRLEADKVPSRLPAPPNPDEPPPSPGKSVRGTDESARGADTSAQTYESTPEGLESSANAQVVVLAQFGADKSARNSDECAPGADTSALLYVAGGREQVAREEENPSSSVTASPPPDAAPAIKPNGKSASRPAAEPRADVKALCDRLAEMMVARGCRKPNITGRWHDAARLLLDKDGVHPQFAMDVLEWSQKSEFWKPNILSMPKFRDKWDTLYQQAEKQCGPHPNGPNATASPGAEVVSFGGNVVALPIPGQRESATARARAQVKASGAIARQMIYGSGSA